MRRLKALTVGIAATVGLFGVGAASAQSDPPPIAVDLVTPRAVFTDDVKLQIRNKVAGEKREVRNLKDPSRVVTAKITVQPGAQFPWHIHPGPVLVTISSGKLIYVDGQDCSERKYPTGTAFWDLGNHVHSAYNPGDAEMVFYATWFDVPAEGPLTIPVDAPDCA